MAARHVRAAGSPEGELARLVNEQLAKLAPHRSGVGPSLLAFDVLARALEAAELDDVPEAPEELLFFASGPLYEETQRAWGSDQADALLLELAPVLDQAWERDRIELGGEFIPATDKPVSSNVRRRSAVRRAEVRPQARTDKARESDMVRIDTQPVPPPDTDISFLGDDELPYESTAPPPSNQSRETIPYTPSAFAERSGLPRVLIVDADMECRRALVSALRGTRCVVTTASDFDGAAALYARLVPSVVIADVNTLAPEYEPLRVALEDLFGEAAEASVILIGDTEPRETTEHVVAFVGKTSSAQEIRDALEPLIDRS